MPQPRTPIGPLPRILVVDDQHDVRQLLKVALESEGYEVHDAADARDGLRCLRDALYSVVVTDYSMPGGTGTWMLLQAEREGLLDGTPAIIITAHPDIQAHTDYPVLEKPLDLDDLFSQVRTLAGGQPFLAGTMRAWTANPSTQVRAELVLYVSGGSPACGRARRRLRDVLRGFVAAQVDVTICDLADDPLAGDHDRIVFTPTLVKRAPGAPVWLLGDLGNGAHLADLLTACNVDRVDD